MASLVRSQQEDLQQYDSPECQDEIGRQLEFLWREAEASGLVLDYQGLNDWSSAFEQEAGAEHIAVLVPEVGRVFKRTIGSLNGELFGVEQFPVPYLLNQGLISCIFGTLTLFEGISRRPGEGTTELLISQRFIKAADIETPYPSHLQLVSFFEQKGFEYRERDFGTTGFVNEDLGLGVMDALPEISLSLRKASNPLIFIFRSCELTRSLQLLRSCRKYLHCAYDYAPRKNPRCYPRP